MKKNDLKQNKKKATSQITANYKLPPVNHKSPISYNLSLNAICQQEEGLVSLLHQYFMKNNFMETLDSFQRDCCKPIKGNIKNHEEIKKQLLTFFDQGLRDQFVIRFSQFVPISMRTKDSQTMKMQFYIQLYFFIYNIHPFLGKKKTNDTISKQSFINYLEGRGSALSKSPQFLQYYALTNLQKPQQHPIFKTLFTKQWVFQIKKRVSYFLQKLYPSGRTPAIVLMYDKFIQNLEKQSQATLTDDHEEQIQIIQQIQQEGYEISPQPVSLEKEFVQAKQANANNNKGKIFQNESQIELLKTHIEQLQQEKDGLFHHLEIQKSKSQHWQNIYKQFSQAAQNIIMESQTKWFQITQQIYTITDQIMDICKKLKEGIPLEDPEVIDKISYKLGKYEKFMKMRIQDAIDSQNIDFSVFAPGGEDDSTFMNRIGRGKLIQLDFNKISACLSAPEKPQIGQQYNKNLWQSKLLLLQSLRWRIHRSKSSQTKRQSILSYTLYDILGLKNPDDNTLLTLLNSQNENLVLETIGFISAMTRDYYGRQYLVCQKLFKPCINLLTNPKINQDIKLHLLLSFQWCSTKKLAQQLMIRYDIIKIIVNKIENQRDTIPPHYLQYVVALLVNILLHKEGPKKAELIKGEIMMALINLIQCQIMSVRSYVHGSLYPLLSHKPFREKAKQFGLLENIKFLLQNKQSQEHQHQLLYLQKKLQNDEDDAKPEQQEQQQDNDQDEYYGDEYKEQGDQYIQLNINGIKGQQLLIKQYALLGPQSLNQKTLIQQKFTQSLKRKEIMMDNSFYDRQSVNTPLLSNNKLRRNISINNSVYSNKSSNRILKSQMNSRGQNGISTSNIPSGNNNRAVRQKLDTVHQNNSQVSLRENVQQNNQISQEQPLDNFKISTQPRFAQISVQQIPQSQSNNVISPNVYENTNEYRNIFQTRAKLVRTPPRK